MKRQKNGTWKLTDAEMNYFSLIAHEASERYAALGLNALSARARSESKEVYEILTEAGYYKDCE